MSVAERSLVDKVKKKYGISQYEILQDFVPFLKILNSASRKQQKIIVREGYFQFWKVDIIIAFWVRT